MEKSLVILLVKEIDFVSIMSWSYLNASLRFLNTIIMVF